MLGLVRATSAFDGMKVFGPTECNLVISAATPTGFRSAWSMGQGDAGFDVPSSTTRDTRIACRGTRGIIGVPPAQSLDDGIEIIGANPGRTSGEYARRVS